MDRAAELLFVLGFHTAALWSLWQHRLIPSPQETMTLFVNFITPPAPEKKEDPWRPPLPPKLEPTPVIEAAPVPLSAGPVALHSELADACRERTPSMYPAISRRQGEEGTVVVHVELDEQGISAWNVFHPAAASHALTRRHWAP